MSIDLNVSLPTEDLRDVLQQPVDAVLDDVTELTPRLREAVERASSALERNTQ